MQPQGSLNAAEESKAVRVKGYDITKIQTVIASFEDRNEPEAKECGEHLKVVKGKEPASS